MDAYVIDWVRTPRGDGRPFAGGTLQQFHPQELLGGVLDALMERVGIDRLLVDDVIAGVGNQTGVHRDNIARLALLAQGWPVEVSGTTVERYCGSGQQALNFAAMALAAGQADAVVACGVEMWSRFEEMPNVLDGDNPKLRRRHPTVPQGISGDLIATLEGFTREDVDAFAARSHQLAEVAQKEGRFDRSLVPVLDSGGGLVLDRDEHVRSGTTAEALGKLKPAFAELGASCGPDSERSWDELCLDVYPHLKEVRHVHHAGNSSGMTDGAAAMLLVTAQFAQRHGLQPRARIVATGVAATEPVVMLTAPAPASRACLDRAGMTVSDLDLVEINEAFAAVPLETIRRLDLNPETVNVNGGAIALGHPIGATGVVLAGTALDELERRDSNVALVTICAGAGLATSTVFERV